MNNIKNSIILFSISVMTFCTLMHGTILASTNETEYQINGSICEFKSIDSYDFYSNDSHAPTSENPTAGNLYINGDFSSVADENGIQYYIVDGTNLQIAYKYTNQLSEDTNGWMLEKEKGNKIADIVLSKSIDYGTIVIQTSRDGNKWHTVLEETNIFENKPENVDSIYKANEVELKNGCYYRIVVAYAKRRHTGKAQLFGLSLWDEYEHIKYAEIYEFCACDKLTAENKADNNKLKYSFNERVKVQNDSGYSIEEPIGKNDVHYGWDLGNFYVEGYSRQTTDENGNVVFLFNPGDKINLYFNLKQDIDALNHNNNLSIADDEKGYDKQFEIDETNMGRGILLVQYTDYKNEKHSLAIYKSYLASNTLAGADTTIQISEEGDYEVALDYQIKNKEFMGTDIFPSFSSYRIAFHFSVRNGNCMIYPFDVTSNMELKNSSFTPDGFYISLAKSKYLDIDIKKEILNNTGSELIEDIRFNKPTKEGDRYIDEGIYTITAHNRYTDQKVTKTIYVGKNNLLKAHVVTGFPISDINDMISRGAVVSENGNIDCSSMTAKPIDEVKTTNIHTDTENHILDSEQPIIKLPSFLILLITLSVVIITIVIVCVVIMFKKRNIQTKDEKRTNDKL